MQQSREELYNAVWSRPVSHLVAKWGVKSGDIKRWCYESDIPMPEQGNWARLKHGKPVEQPPLPPKDEAEEPIVYQTSRQVEKPPRANAV